MRAPEARATASDGVEFMFTESEKQHIRRSWQLAAPLGETVADLFYARLFELKPEYRALFKSDMDAQKRKLLAMLDFIVRAMDWPEEAWRDEVDADNDLFLVVLALGRRHLDLYRIPDESYDVVGAALLWTLDYGLGEAFTADVKDAWVKVYTLLAKTMKMGRYAVGEGSVVREQDRVRHA